MASISRFRLTSPLSDSDKVDKALKDYYNSWRGLNQNSKAPFIALDNKFKDKHLSDLEPGPLRLYLYFCFAANNDYGHSWFSIQKMADFFDTQTRTIDNWIKVLVEKDLIYRAQKGKKSHTTYLIPFSDTMIQHSAPKERDEDNQELLDDLVKKIDDMSFIYGEIVKVCHLFQWVSRKGKPVNRDNSAQLLLIITRRKNGVLIGHLHYLRKSKHLSVNQLNIEGSCRFQSPFTFDGQNIRGIALPSIPSLKGRSSIKEMLEMIEELATIPDWKIDDCPEVEYGDKDEMIPVIEGEIEEQGNEDETDDE